MKFFRSKKLLGSRVLCGMAAGKVLPNSGNLNMSNSNSWEIGKINLEGVLGNPTNAPQKGYSCCCC